MLDLREVAEVDEKAHINVGCVVVVEDLSPVFRGQTGNRLDLDDNAPETDKIGLVGSIEFRALVAQVQHLLGFKRNLLSAEFNFQTFLVYSLQKTATHFVVHSETCTQDPIRLFFVREMLNLSLPHLCHLWASAS